MKGSATKSTENQLARIPLSQRTLIPPPEAQNDSHRKLLPQSHDYSGGQRRQEERNPSVKQIAGANGYQSDELDRIIEKISARKGK